MIAILSQESIEVSTESVMEWLESWNQPCVRINGSDLDGGGKVSVRLGAEGVVEAEVPVDGVALPISQIRSAWFRRWHYSSDYRRSQVLIDERKLNVVASCHHLHGELETLAHFIFRPGGFPWLGGPFKGSVNKLEVLDAASRAGLDVPDTLITSDRETARAFIEKHGTVITKPASEVLMVGFETELCTTYTTALKLEDFEKLPWRGRFPSLFQQALEKAYEIRSFYLDGEIHSMAMFTQRHEATQTDFRRYTYEDPARTVPYLLPRVVEDQLRRLMEMIGLDTGSFDFIRTKDGRLVFLEVNPAGQFGMVSEPCNYFLERRVAQALVDRAAERN